MRKFSISSMGFGGDGGPIKADEDVAKKEKENGKPVKDLSVDEYEKC